MGALALAACSRPEPAPVILISVDTLRADRLGAYGYTLRPTSPEIDALAADGVLFEQHVVSSPWTAPSHMSLLTSLWPNAHGLRQSFLELAAAKSGRALFNRLPDATVTLAEALRERGYATAAFTGGGPLDPAIGFGQGFERYDTSMWKPDDAAMQAMLDWIDAQGARPFFLFWHNFEVHAPYLRDTFLAEVLDPPRAAGVAAELAALRRALEGSTPDLAAQQSLHRRFVTMLERHGALDARVTGALYDGGIRAFDSRLGQLLTHLRQRGLYDRSWLVLTSDHGEELGDHSPRIYDAHGHSLYEELIRAPLLIKPPGSDGAGTRVTALVRNIDVMPTLLRGVGAPLPEAAQGVPLQDLWRGGPEAPPQLAFGEALAFAWELKSVRTPSHKLVLGVAPDTVARRGRGFLPEPPASRQLFDLEADPGETHDLLEEPAAPGARALAEELEQRLRHHLAPATPALEQVELEPGTLRRLAALGYLAPGESADAARAEVRTYAGTLPCADCAGRRLTLTLFPDGRFRLRSVYLGRDGAFYDLGRWQQSGDRLELQGGSPASYRVVDPETLRLLDSEGREIASQLNHDLTRQPMPDPVAGPMRLRGLYRYLADAAVVEECRTGKSYPVVLEADHRSVERAYLDLGLAGAPALLDFEGRFEERSPEPGLPPREVLVVERFGRFEPGAGCDAGS